MHRFNFITNNVGMFNIFIYVPAGSIYETDGIRGISHLLEHMLMKHTLNYTNKNLSKNITKLGGLSNAGTAKDMTYYYIKTHIDNYKESIKIMNDIINNSVFTNNELEQEKKIVLEEFAQSIDRNDYILDDLSILSVLPSNNEYSFPVKGVIEDIKNITINVLRKYMKKTYTHFMLFINCDIKFINPVKEEIVKYFGKSSENIDISSEIKLKNIYNVKDIGDIIIKTSINYKQFSTILSFITFPVTKVKESVILNFIRFILTSSGFNSILFKEIREKRGLVYSINSSHEDTRYIGILQLHFSSTNSNTQYIISIILSYILDIIKKGISETKLKYYKVSLLNRTKYKR